MPFFSECHLAFEWLIVAVRAVTVETTIAHLNYLTHRHEKKYLWFTFSEQKRKYPLFSFLLKKWVHITFYCFLWILIPGYHNQACGKPLVNFQLSDCTWLIDKWRLVRLCGLVDIWWEFSFSQFIYLTIHLYKLTGIIWRTVIFGCMQKLYN